MIGTCQTRGFIGFWSKKDGHVLISALTQQDTPKFKAFSKKKGPKMRDTKHFRKGHSSKKANCPNEKCADAT
jgi:hypothetical protein